MIKKIIVIVLLLILSTAMVLLYKTVATNTDTKPQENTTTTEKIEDQATGMANPASVYCKEQGGNLSIRKDQTGGEYGVCVFEDGSECEEWKFFRKECTKGTTAAETSSDPEKDKNDIEQALVREEGISLDTMVVTVRENTGKYAAGGMRHKEPDFGGAYFFAAKTSAGWTIVAAGNGIITCEDVAPYPDLPVSMIPECYDVPTDTLVKR